MERFVTTLQKAVVEKKIPEKLHPIFLQFFTTYSDSLVSYGLNPEICDSLFTTLLKKVIEDIQNPYIFQSFHERITAPFDYYDFGNEFVRPLIDYEKSKVLHPDNIDKIEKQLKAKENVIFFGNHQTEVDPHLLSLILEKDHPRIATDIIFVAGDRVLTDPMAKPFSMGRNLLCIYSKRHIENPPEKKLEKQHHNQRTMKVMRDLLIQGGKCIYVAPSGGRDRPDQKGKVEVAPFDAQSIEMFRLMATQAKRPTHFYPLALATFDILPPPPIIEKALGESRRAKRGPVFFSFGDEIDMNNYPGMDHPDRHERRSLLANHIWNLVNTDYVLLKSFKK